MADYLVATESLIGGRAENQDSYRIGETEHRLLAIVCDGMGGLNGGKIAAELAVKTIFKQVISSGGISPRKSLMNAITEANKVILSEGMSTPGLHGMGTTVVALLVNENFALAAHVGDSRIYQLRDGAKIFRTFDHSLVFEWVNEGILTEEEARISPHCNIINCALGTNPHLDISISDGLSYKQGDRFLLCTDGIWGALPEPEIIRMASIQQPVSEVLNNLINSIDRLGVDKGGGHDNMTAILIEMENDSR